MICLKVPGKPPKTLCPCLKYLPQPQVRTLGKSLDLVPIQKDDWNPAASRALLVVATAAMFQRRLDQYLPEMKPKTDMRTGLPFKGSWPPPPLSKCYDAPNTVLALSESWNLILAVDYKPIFEAGRNVLNSLDSPQFVDAVKTIITWARMAAGQIGGLRHDVMGRIFHKLLDSRYDGSFYTSVPASIILAGLALRDRSDIPSSLKNMRIIDPACGTGTLLIAAAERIKDISGDKYDNKAIIEDVLTGIDINVTALHIAATTLGLLSPTTQFKKMDIRQAPFGRTGDGKIAAGSLELYGESGTFPIYNWADAKAMRQIETDQKRPSVSYTGSADLVIMNPPFTRNDLRHDQLGSELEKLVKSRESDIFRSAPFPVNKASSGPMFLVLAEHLVKKSGTVALVLPFVAATNNATLRVRKFFAEKFHVETLVASHDPGRVWFSESTGIPEILVVLKSKKRSKPTTLVQLATIDTPSTFVHKS